MTMVSEHAASERWALPAGDAVANPPGGVGTVLDVTIPVFNEEAGLADAVGRLHAHLHATFPYPFRITIADNASTDGTWRIAQDLADRLPDVVAVHLKQKGRGRALASVWAASDAAILAYMDVDLSTDLGALWPLVAPLLSGHSDVAIGTRLSRGSRVARGPKRELISRCYNLILRTTLGVGFSDAQCGFKAIRAEVARELLPLVHDPTWFFDTELLTLAERCDLRIHEVPVDWFDDPDSRVDIVATAVSDLRGVWRVRRALRRGELPVAAVAERLGRGTAPNPAWRQLLAFGVVGLVTTLVHLGLFATLSTWVVGSQVANAAALGAATVVNTAANRRWTFGVRTRRDGLRHQVQGFVVLLITLAMTAGGLALLHSLAPRAPVPLETIAVALASALSTAVKFLLMRHWMFGPRTRQECGILSDSLQSVSGNRGCEGSHSVRDGSAG